MRIPLPHARAILGWTRQSGDVAPRTSLTGALWVQHFILMSNINGNHFRGNPRGPDIAHIKRRQGASDHARKARAS